MASHRRKEYQPIRDHVIYNDEFDRLRMASKILNTESQPNVYSILWDRQNIESLLLEIDGDENGEYIRNHEKRMALLPAVKNRLQNIQDKYARRQQERINQGYEPYEVMPADLMEWKQKTEAQEDILLEEKDILNQRLQVYLDEIEIQSESNVLKYGLVGSGKFHGIGTGHYNPEKARAELDGQFLSMTDEGFLIIDDKRSPYNQMRVSDYHKLSEMWLKERASEQDKAFKEMQETYKAEGLPVPQSQPVKSLRVINKKSLPPFPDWAERYSKKTTQSIEDNNVHRTK